MTLVKVSSHRARRKLFRVTGELQAYFSWKREGEWYDVSDEHLDQILDITGVTRARSTNDLCKCWK